MMQNTTYSLWRQRLGYGVADLSCNLVWQLISLYLMFFYTDIMGLPAYYAGLMFLVTRLVDGVADVLMGLVIDNTHTRWGRCRPYLLIGAVPFGLLCMMAFYVPDFGLAGKLWYAFLTYLCLSFLYTLVNIPFCAMLPFITNDSRERTTLSAVRIVMGFGRVDGRGRCHTSVGTFIGPWQSANRVSLYRANFWQYCHFLPPAEFR